MKSKRLKRKLTRKILRSMLREEQVSLRGDKRTAIRLTKFDTDFDRFPDSPDDDKGQ